MDEVINRKKSKVNAPTAKSKLADLLARRDHSPLELRAKLAGRFPPEEIEEALAWAESRGWIPNDEVSYREFSLKIGESYHRRNKGIRFINSKLYRLGLPEIPSDPGVELEKARRLVENKFTRKGPASRDLRVRVHRFLTSRGFEGEVIRAVLRDFLNKDSHDDE